MSERSSSPLFFSAAPATASIVSCTIDSSPHTDVCHKLRKGTATESPDARTKNSRSIFRRPVQSPDRLCERGAPPAHLLHCRRGLIARGTNLQEASTALEAVESSRRAIETLIAGLLASYRGWL